MRKYLFASWFVLGVAAFLLFAKLAEAQTCQPGVNCVSSTFQTPCVPTTSLGTCNSSKEGTFRCDNTSDTLKFCDGVNWIDGTGAGNLSDGGVSTGNFVRKSGDTMSNQFGGTGVLVINSATSSTSPALIIDGGSLCFTGACVDRIRSSVTPGQSGLLFQVDGGNGTSVSKFSVKENEVQVVSAPFRLLGASSTAVVEWADNNSGADVVDALQSNTPTQLRGALTIIQRTPYVQDPDAGTFTVQNSDGGPMLVVDDQKANAPDFCLAANGAASGGCLSQAISTATGSFAAHCVLTGASACEGDTTATFLGSFFPGATRTTTRISCSWGTAGVGGTTGVVVRVVDDSGATICSCNLAACTVAANIMSTCTCAGSLGNSRAHGVTFTTGTDCTTNPLNTFCNVTYTTP